MGTLGYRKPACKRGHVAPERTKSGACVPCGKAYRRETYQRDRERRPLLWVQAPFWMGLALLMFIGGYLKLTE